MHIFILILSVITHGWRLEWLNSPLAPTLNCLVCNSVLSTPPQTAFLGEFWSLHKTDAVLVTWSRKCSPFFCFLVPLAASTLSGRGEPQDSAAERCEQFISRNYPDLRLLPAWRPQQKLIFLENPSDLETQEMNPVPRVAAESLGFEPRLRAVQILQRLQNFCLQRKENRPCVCWQRLGPAPGTPCVHN